MKQFLQMLVMVARRQKINVVDVGHSVVLGGQLEISGTQRNKCVQIVHCKTGHVRNYDLDSFDTFSLYVQNDNVVLVPLGPEPPNERVWQNVDGT